MSDIIHLLPDSVANQIAAGEVIQRPASVLKELVENAIDAGAGYIQIQIKDAGRTLIQVVDDGKGMSDTDARMSFERHATSKIKSADDLFALRTMGFRGEALASIAAVAQVELRTRREEDELGTFIEIAGTRVFRQEAVQCAKGTSFQVKNLFFNVPARRRFLKSDNVEKSHILNEFYRIVLVNTSISFSFFDGDEEVYNLPASNQKIRIEQVFGKSNKKKWQQQLLTVETSTQMVSIHGYVGKPEYAQKSANQYFFVNGRFMKHPYFHKAVMMAYNQMIQGNESPNYFIYFQVDPDTIDINIHPTKTEIKFENEQAIWSILSATVKESLGKFNVMPSIDFDQEGAPDIPVTVSLENIRPPQTNFNPEYNPFRTTSAGASSSGSSGSGTYKRPDFDWEQLYGNFEQQASTESQPQASTIEWDVVPSQDMADGFESMIHVESSLPGQQLIQSDETLKKDHYQFKNKFIITSLKSGLLVIDQNRAHTRILFDQFLSEMDGKRGSSQQILFPEMLELTADENLFLQQIRPELHYVGFDLEEADACSYQVKGVPAQVNVSEAVVLLHEMIHKAKNQAEDPTLNIHETLALTMAKTAAIKNGQRLQSEEMNDLIDRLFSCVNPNYTPESKKIMVVFECDELDKRFQ